ncbi:uncharacterized protein N7484_008154 [Penicillium longicatenatum]|uniref:uncharacterized protein n=1 Tax=Penicillium longicatenatum TaxID=1561947 RepID=UPI0025480E22|nr:uncharacterized protein N7484_008154 [Penicillium longicatenatum]KAJ5640292.1 hypothetical protein N7484_008154 [Penicillium longicatenatum]
MASKKLTWVKKRQLNSSRAKVQQRNRRKQSLFKKAKEFVFECESDIFVAVRIRKTGQIYILDSSTDDQWLKDLSNLEFCYPRPIRESVDCLPHEDESPPEHPDGAACSKSED